MPLGRSYQKMSRRGEEKTAADIRGRRQPQSGAGPIRKADVRSDIMLVERKDTTSAGYRLSFADLEKLRQHAAKEDRWPVFQVCGRGREYAVIDWKWFMDMVVDYASRE